MRNLAAHWPRKHQSINLSDEGRDGGKIGLNIWHDWPAHAIGPVNHQCDNLWTCVQADYLHVLTSTWGYTFEYWEHQLKEEPVDRMSPPIPIQQGNVSLHKSNCNQAHCLTQSCLPHSLKLCPAQTWGWAQNNPFQGSFFWKRNVFVAHFNSTPVNV